ncbi:TPA: hypothetical protein ACIFC2_003564, partial [Acinetobacter baumannii]
KVEELKASHHGEVIGHEVHFKKIKQERDELQTLYIQQGINMLKLQKRVDAAKYYMKNIFSGVAEVDQCHLGDLLDILDGEIVDELEQALKGEGQ